MNEKNDNDDDSFAVYYEKFKKNDLNLLFFNVFAKMCKRSEEISTQSAYVALFK